MIIAVIIITIIIMIMDLGSGDGRGAQNAPVDCLPAGELSG